MLSKILSAATVGLDAKLIEVEVDIPNEGLPSFTIVGLPDKAVEESKERVRSAIKNSGADFPTTRITVNLAPADLPKVGPAYDLPIAIGILVASGQIAPDVENLLFVGELSLNGNLRHTNGILPIANLVREKKLSGIFVPHIDQNEAQVIPSVKVYGCDSLLQLVRFFNGTFVFEKNTRIRLKNLIKVTDAEFDFNEIIGQEQAKRAMEIVAAGGHNILLKGTPGSGKTMLARALPGILPKLSEDESLEVTKIYSITGNLPQGESLVTTRPFRSPHHTTSRIGLIGGGSNPKPGEVSLAHRGVLFLDEFPEFPRGVLECLRQPMEDGIVTISRAKGTYTYPAEFLLVAASNPCPCGYYGNNKKPCKCLPGQITRYQKRISGPILDRIDMHVTVPAVDTEKLIGKRDHASDSSKTIQKKVQTAREIQIKRFENNKERYGIKSNSEMKTKHVKKICKLGDKSQTLLRSAISTMNLSARSYFKIIKVARTIADLDNNNKILPNHVAEALQYRPKDDEL